MPITKSAKKSLRSSERKRAHNLILKNKLLKSLKRVTKDNVNETISLIDKIAKVHFISKNKAARLKSRLGKKFGTPKQEKREKKIEKSAEKKTKAPTPKKIVKKSSKIEPKTKK